MCVCIHTPLILKSPGENESEKSMIRLEISRGVLVSTWKSTLTLTRVSSVACFVALQGIAWLFTSVIDPTADEYGAASAAPLEVEVGKMPTLSAWPAESASSILFKAREEIAVSVWISVSTVEHKWLGASDSSWGVSLD